MRLSFPSCLVAILTWGAAVSLQGDITVRVPPPIGNTAVLLPFLIQDSPDIRSLRYQQVYAAAAFATVDPTNVYVTQIVFWPDENSEGAICLSTNLEVRLSTTSKGPDTLSTNFAENVGTDETVVFVARTNYSIPAIGGVAFALAFTEPFVYNPANGHLLVDVRVQTSGPSFPQNYWLDGHEETNDSVSRVYADSIDATSATVADSAGLVTLIQFSAIPSLQIRVESVFGTNRPVIRWPAQPSVFALQNSSQLGSNAVWQTITNDILGTPAGPERAIYLPTPPPGSAGFYRLIWEAGPSPSQPAAAAPAFNNGSTLPH